MPKSKNIAALQLFARRRSQMQEERLAQEEEESKQWGILNCLCMVLAGLCLLVWIEWQSNVAQPSDREKLASTVLTKFDQQALHKFAQADPMKTSMEEAAKNYEKDWVEARKIRNAIATPQPVSWRLVDFHVLSHFLQFVGWAFLAWGVMKLIQLLGAGSIESIQEFNGTISGLANHKVAAIVPSLLAGTIAVGATAAIPLDTNKHDQAVPPTPSVQRLEGLDVFKQTVLQLQAANLQLEKIRSDLEWRQDCQQDVTRPGCLNWKPQEVNLAKAATELLQTKTNSLREVIVSNSASVQQHVSTEFVRNSLVRGNEFNRVNEELASLRRQEKENADHLSQQVATAANSLEGRIRSQLEVQLSATKVPGTRQLIERWTSLTGGDPSKFGGDLRLDVDKLALAHIALDDLERFRKSQGLWDRVENYLWKAQTIETCMLDDFPKALGPCPGNQVGRSDAASPKVKDSSVASSSGIDAPSLERASGKPTL